MLGEFTIPEVNELFDMEYVLEDLRTEIEAATEVDRFAPISSPEQVEPYVLCMLKGLGGRNCSASSLTRSDSACT
jgi:hypothetical protein